MVKIFITQITNKMINLKYKKKKIVNKKKVQTIL